MNTPTTQLIPVSHITASEPPAEIPIRQESESESGNDSGSKQHNRKFPGPSLQEQRDFLNGFNREAYYKKYVR